LSLRQVIFGGEALDFSTLKIWVERHGFEKPALINMYGITETTVHVTCYKLQQKDLETHQSIIGLPLPDLQAFVLDSFFAPVPKGVVGELFVGGAGVASGYLNRADLSAEKFIRKDIAGIGEQYLYRTGDLVRTLAQGNLEYLGRIDDQVKIRGFRIELGEIEFNINAIDVVRENIVLIKPDMQGNDAIVAYVAVNKIDEVFSSDLRSALVGRLPEYMIPKAFVLLERFPLTVNGKIDKHALPDVDWSSLSSHEYISPRNETENILADIWSEVLKIDGVGIYDNFFEVGGHSLLATQIVSRIRERLSVDIPLNVIFETPTIADIAFYLIEKEALEVDEDVLNALLDEIEGNDILEVTENETESEESLKSETRKTAAEPGI
jgi:acyl carrier protein